VVDGVRDLSKTSERGQEDARVRGM
jgi:hypothetical protein